VKLFKQTKSNLQEDLEKKKTKYVDKISNLGRHLSKKENEISTKKEERTRLEDLNNKLSSKIEELKTNEKKLRTDTIDEYNYLKEKSLVDKALIDDLIIKLDELNNKVLDS